MAELNKKDFINQLETRIRSTGSFERSIEKTKEIDFYFEMKNEVISLFAGKPGNNLTSIDNSVDKDVVEIINTNSDMTAFITSFNNQTSDNIAGSKISKKIAIELLNTVKNPGFIDSSEGKVVYEAYKSFVQNLNINTIEYNNKIIFDTKVLKNVVYYMVLGCESCPCNLVEVCESFNSLLSCTNVSLNTKMISSVEIEEIHENTTNEIVSATGEAKKELSEIENSKKSYMSKAWGATYGLVKWSLSGNKLLQGAQITLYTAIFGFSAKVFFPILFTKASTLAFSTAGKLTISSDSSERTRDNTSNSVSDGSTMSLSAEEISDLIMEK